MSEFTTNTDMTLALALAVTTIVVFVILAIAMLCMIVHLVCKTYKKWSNKQQETTRETMILIYFFLATIFGITAFEVSLLMTIILVVQIFLLDDIFVTSYGSFTYSIAILDSLGHLAMLSIFIGRFQYAFRNQIFNQPKWLIRTMYLMLAILSLVAIVIPSSETDLLALEIAWELCVESMILFILFMFISNLYKLLQLSLITHLKKNGNPNRLLSEITKISLERSKSSNKKESTKSKKSKNILLTIDGCVVDPGPHTPEPMSKSDNDNAAMDTPPTAPKPPQNIGYNHTLDILTVMTKMTVLVIITGTISYLSIIGNFIIKSYYYDAIWMFILPVFDMVGLSLMSYFQFNFTHSIYRGMCHCVDSLFLRCMLSFIAYCWKIEPNVKELETKSTVASDETHLSDPVSSEDIQITN
eukprot:146858_1